MLGLACGVALLLTVHAGPAPPGQTQSLTSPDQVPEGLAPSDWSSIRAAYDAGRHRFQPTATGWQAGNPGQRWTTAFDRRGFLTSPQSGDWTWGLELQAYGFESGRRSVAGVPAVTAAGQRLAYQWDALVEEWFINDRRGLEHGFIVRERPAAAPDAPLSTLNFLIGVRGGLRPHLTADARGVDFRDASGLTVLTYDGLKVWDADGRMLASRFELAEAADSAPDASPAVRLLVDERGARYPLTIDPVAQQAYLKADLVTAGDFFGYSVAVSGDTVVVGAFSENGGGATISGAAYVFVRSGTTWTQQAYLKAGKITTNDQFGWSVAISGDTLVIGARRENSSTTGINSTPDESANNAGAAYVFVRSGTTWTQQAYLKAGQVNTGDQFGSSVAVSGDTVIVGARYEDSGTTGVNGTPDESAADAGAAYVFVRSGTTWTQQAYLKASQVSSGDEFGAAVAISGDTAVVGAYLEDSGTTGINSTPNESAADAGAAYVFVRSGTTWTQQAYLKAGQVSSGDEFGTSVAISGNTVVVGANQEDSGTTGTASTPNESAAGAGAAYVFVRSGTAWTQQTYLKAGQVNANDEFGVAVAVGGDVVVVGARFEDSGTTGVNRTPDESANSAGAAYVFSRSGTTWTQRAYLKAGQVSSGDSFGRSVAVSGDTVVVGATLEDSGTAGINRTPDELAADAGAAYIFTGIVAAVQSVTAPAAAVYNAGDTLTFTVTFNEAVTVSGTPRLALTLGSTTRYAAYTATGSTTLALNFTSTVQAGDNDPDGIALLSPVELNGGTLVTASNGAAAALTFTPPATGGIVVDTTAPTVAHVTASTANGTKKIGDTVTVDAVFAESVNVTGTPRLTLETGATDRTVDYTAGSGSATLSFTYTVQTGDISGDLDYTSTGALALNGGSIADPAGNPATLTLAAPGAAGSLAANKALVIDGVRPLLASAITLSDTALKFGDTATVTFTYTEAVTGFTVADVSAPNGTLSGLASSDGGLTWTATLTPAATTTAATHVLTLDYTGLADLAGNLGAGSATSGNYAIDTVLPTLASVAIVSNNPAPSRAKTGDTVTVTFTASEAIAPPTAIVAGRAATVANTTGNTYTATTTLLAADPEGTVALSIAFTDLAGNSGTAVTATTNTSAVTFDRTAPLAPAITAITDDTGANATDGITQDSTLILSGTAEAHATVALSKGGTALGTATATGTGAWSFDSAATTLGAGDHSFAATATDLAGNPGPTSATYLVTVDSAIAAPAITAITTDTGSSATDGITHDKTLVFTGAAEAGSTVTLLRNALGPLGTATANGTGAWTFDYTATTLADATYLFTATAADPAGNTSAASADFPVTIDTAAPVITAGTATGDFNAPFSHTISATGAAASYTATPLPAGLTLNPATGVITGTPAAAGVTPVALTATDTAGNTGTATLTLTINPLTPVITWPAPAAGTYGTPLSAAQLNATANVPGTFAYTPAAGTTPDAGTQTLSAAFTPTDTVNYHSVPATSVTLVVAKATPTITWPTPATLTYGTPLSAAQLNATANLPGTFAYTPAAGTTPAAGMQTLSAAFTPTDTVNYHSVPATTVTLVVAKATPSITWPTPAALTYGTPLSTAQLNATANIPGTFAYTPAAGTTPDAGTQTLSAAFTPTDTVNYHSVPATSVTLTVARRDLTVVGVTATRRPYDGTTNAVLVFTAASLVGVVLPDSVTLNSAAAVGTFAHADAGPAKPVTITGITLGGTSADNYTVTPPTATAAIDPANVIVTLGDLAATYDGTAKSVAVTTTPSVSTRITYLGSASAPSAAGRYAVAASVTDRNYTGTADGTLVIARATQTIAFPAPPGTPALGTPVALSATASSGLPVAFALVAGPATLDGASLTFTAAGTAVVLAAQDGDDNFLAAPSVEIALATAARTAQTITFAAPADRVTTDSAFTLSATATSGLPVAFAVVNGPAVLSGTTLTLSGNPGTVTLRATQAGDATFAAAPDVIRSITIVDRDGTDTFFGELLAGGAVAPDPTRSPQADPTLANPDRILAGKVGDIAAVVSRNTRRGQLIVVAPGLGLHLSLPLALAADGTYTVPFTRDGRPLNIEGSLVGSTLTGRIPLLGLAFTASAQTRTGPTAALAGYYQSAALGDAPGGTASIVGTDGQVLIIASTAALTTGALGSVNPDGTFDVAAAGATLTGTIDATTTAIAGVISSPGRSRVDFSGLAVTTLRTDRVVALSSRVRVGPAAGRTLISGFIIGGPGAKRVLLRGVGPGLNAFGLTGALPDPRLELYDGAGKLLLENDDWSGADTAETTSRVGAFALAPGSKDAVLLTTLAPGAYTVHVVDGGRTGVALAEIYDAGANPDTEAQRLIAISTRGEAAGGENVLIGGFIITGNAPKKVLVRGIGPGLTAFGVPGALVDPRLRVYRGGELIGENGDWSTVAADAAANAQAARDTGVFALPVGSKDAALILTLAPGAYTAQVGGADSISSGIALVEIYEVP